MAASLLHFGQELSDRFPLLRHAGYSVTLYAALDEFQDALQSGAGHDAVSVSDVDEYASPLAARTARAHSPAPLVLFRTRRPESFPVAVDRSAVAPATGLGFDLIVSPDASSQGWMESLAALIARSREIRFHLQSIDEASILLRQETGEIEQSSLAEGERLEVERARNASLGVGPANLVDRILTCSYCGLEFVFSAAEQFFFRQRGFVNDPKRCRKCRTDRKRGPAWMVPETVVTCAVCGVLTSVPFKPRQGRPVLCRSCFEKR
jgi:CxxC-x17-CxxC domain-containing protein